MFEEEYQPMTDSDWKQMEQEYAEADLELMQLLWLSLDRCHKAGAREDDLKFLAWQTGCTGWTPNAKRRTASVS